MIRTILFLLLSGCGIPTAYVAASAGEDGFGYRSSSEANNTYRITFEANSSTPLNDTRQYCLRRASEIALANGFEYFEVLNTAQETRGIHSYTLSVRVLHHKEEAANGEAFEASKFKCLDENDWRVKNNIAPKCT